MTLREHLDAAIALEGEWPDMAFGEVLDHVHAARAILDAAEQRFQAHDPENGGDAWYRLVPDVEAS